MGVLLISRGNTNTFFFVIQPIFKMAKIIQERVSWGKLLCELEYEFYLINFVKIFKGPFAYDIRFVDYQISKIPQKLTIFCPR